MAASSNADAHVLHAVALQGLGHQVGLGDGALLAPRVAAQVEDLQAVLQGLGDLVAHVGGGQEQHLGKVEAHVQVVVLEGEVLLGVQHLQQGRAGVAAPVGAHLVDLVQQHERVAHPALLHERDDPPRHGADVGAPVAPDLRLVPHAAQGEAQEGPVQGPGDGSGQGGLAHPGRAHQAKDGPAQAGARPRRRGGVAQPAHDGQVLQDPHLDLLQAGMVLVQDALGLVQVQVLVGVGLPGQRQQPVDVAARHGGFGALGGHALQPVQLLQGLLLGLLAHLRLEDLLAQAADLVLLALAPGGLRPAHLLAQHEGPVVRRVRPGLVLVGPPCGAGRRPAPAA